MPRIDYEQHKQEQAERFAELAEKAKKESQRVYESAHKRAEMIPFGQPILVGHHSEKRHRSDISKIDNAMRKSVELDEKAKYYKRKAENAQSNTAISSDDPEAVTKLLEKIASAEKMQALMKQCNAIIRKHKDEESQIKALVAIGRPEAQARELIKPDFCGRIGFADYALQNNNANINRMKKRVEALRKEYQRQETPPEPIKGNGFEVVENVDLNRIQLLFDNIPNEATRSKLKSWGFRWSPYNKAWQRHLNNAGRYAVKQVLDYFNI